MKLSHKDALSVLGLARSVTFAEIKQAYRKATSHYHPDRNPAGLEMMKIINAAYTALSDYDYPTTPIEEESTLDNLGEELSAALNAIINLGLTIEICGTWIWVSGDTKPHKDIIKAAGYRWAPKKLMWHWRPSDYKSKSRGKYSIDDIRARHGSVNVKSKTYERLSA